MSACNSPQQQHRNHQRTCQRAPPPAHLPPVVQEPKPVRLASPGMGYPFPLMLSRANTPREEILASPYKGDGWDTPASSSRASSFATSSRRPSTFTSTFSDSSCSTRSSSDALSSADDVSSASSPFSERADVNASAGGPVPPTTPAEHAHSRVKHAGSTPGAPPPNPLVTLERPPEMLDLDDIREASPNSARTSPVSDASHDRKDIEDDGAEERKKRNPLTGGLATLSMSGSHSTKEDGRGVGPKVEVD
ncbi:proteophosphoglycan ppg4 [Rhodotorula toruloides]|uniref:Proteophosphoglycan ppg4 n=1 Tax=Rhodotorula toruloides TaxID=5286 RepID=A0A511KAJ3_RHOTO|nr:proteophosphoglycan ppg4 [Rhodotorula toruloides]